MNSFYIEITNIIFALDSDSMIRRYLSKRTKVLNLSDTIPTDVVITCKKFDCLEFDQDRNIHDQEPDISEESLYREILDLGKFSYSRKDKILNIEYVDSEKYPYDSYEVVVDTIFQFMYLILIDYAKLPIHASVLSFNNLGAIIMGDSGVGKSTLEIALLGEGLSFFADDVAFVTEETEIMGSNENIIACSQHTAEIIKQLYHKDITPMNVMESERKPSINSKFIFMASENFPTTHLKKLSPTLIIFPEITEGSNYTIRELSKKEALTTIISLTISKKFSSTEKELYFHRLKNLVLSTKAIKLSRGENAEISNLKELCKQIVSLIVE